VKTKLKKLLSAEEESQTKKKTATLCSEAKSGNSVPLKTIGMCIGICARDCAV